MAALAGRDLDAAPRLPTLDDPIDELNPGMLASVLEASHDAGMLEWGIHICVMSRQLERIDDNAVDIGEQVAFGMTGQFPPVHRHFASGDRAPQPRDAGGTVA
jgi:phosphate transport system protein